MYACIAHDIVVLPAVIIQNAEMVIWEISMFLRYFRINFKCALCVDTLFICI